MVCTAHSTRDMAAMKLNEKTDVKTGKEKAL
jgi:hypothetical protein